MVPAWFPFPMGSLPLNRSTLINIYSSRFLEHLRCLLDYNSLRIPWVMALHLHCHDQRHANSVRGLNENDHRTEEPDEGKAFTSGSEDE